MYIAKWGAMIMIKTASKNKKGLITLGIGGLCLIISLLVNRFVEVDDILCVIFLTFSLIVEIIGLFQIIKDTYK